MSIPTSLNAEAASLNSSFDIFLSLSVSNFEKILIVFASSNLLISPLLSASMILKISIIFRFFFSISARSSFEIPSEDTCDKSNFCPSPILIFFPVIRTPFIPVKTTYVFLIEILKKNLNKFLKITFLIQQN